MSVAMKSTPINQLPNSNQNPSISHMVQNPNGSSPSGHHVPASGHPSGQHPPVPTGNSPVSNSNPMSTPMQPPQMQSQHQFINYI